METEVGTDRNNSTLNRKHGQWRRYASETKKAQAVKKSQVNVKNK